MGTRSDIIAKLSDGRFARIYCHWDGYLSNNGRILAEHYTDQEKIDQLMALGDLSSLKEEIGIKHPFDGPSYYLPGSKFKVNPAREEHEKKYGKMCLAYGRDRGEKDCAAKIGDTLKDVWPEPDSWAEFTYVWDGQTWYVGNPDVETTSTQTMQLLRIALQDEAEGKITEYPVKVFGAVVGHHGARVAS